jgi:hypothetical protein
MTRREAILRCLRNYGPCSSFTVSMRTGIPAGAVSRVLYDLTAPAPPGKRRKVRIAGWATESCAGEPPRTKALYARGHRADEPHPGHMVLRRATWRAYASRRAHPERLPFDPPLAMASIFTLAASCT